jgi:predicted methyltransferase
MKKRKDFRRPSMFARAAGPLLGAVTLLHTACGPQKSSVVSDAHPTSDARAHEHGQHGRGDGHDGHGGGHGHGHQVNTHHHRFDAAARWSKVFDDPSRDEWQRPARVVELMAIKTGMTVADVGAGTGYFTPHLSRAVGASGKVIAEDVEPAMVEWLEARVKRERLENVQPLLGTADDPRLPPGGVDRVLVVDTWHHVENRAAFSKKLAAALAPGGAVFIVDFTLESPHGPPRSARLAPDTVAADLRAAGLTTEVLADAGLPHQYVVRGRR